MGFFNDYAIANSKMHPVAELFHIAMQECEKLPASEQQTKTIVAIENCRKEVEQQLQLLTIISSKSTVFNQETP